MQPMWAGIVGSLQDDGEFEIAISVHDSVYATDFAWSCVPYVQGDLDANAKAIEEHVLDTLRNFSKEHMCKFLGAGAWTWS